MIDGQWKIVVETPMGPQEATATLATSGGALTGTIVNSFGSNALEDGTVDGDRAGWTVRTDVPRTMVLRYEGLFTPNTVEGTVDPGVIAKAGFKGVRVS